MIGTEFKRYLRSKYIFIMSILCLTPIIISYYFTNVDKVELYDNIISNSSDFNLDAGIRHYEGINAFTYLFDFIFSPDFYIIFVIVLSMSLGVIFGGTELKNRTTGFGNMIFSRINVQKGNIQILLSQIVFSIIFIVVFFTIITIITLLLFPVNEGKGFTIVIPMQITSISQCVYLLIEHISKLLIYIVSVVCITYGISYYVSNKYIILFVPLIVYMVPLFVCSIVGSFFKPLGNVLSYLVADQYLLSIYDRCTSRNVDLGSELILPVTLVIIALILLCNYCRNINRNYL
ncbi:MAG: hypothetical protein J6L69_06890 [Lachnospiraceae bacterium]|nr:hypothetical protein [Lachnospiraceae bacterium]